MRKVVFPEKMILIKQINKKSISVTDLLKSQIFVINEIIKLAEEKYIEENDYLESIRIENYFIDTYKPKYNKAGSKLHWAIISYGDKFDETKIPYPKGWLKII